MQESANCEPLAPKVSIRSMIALVTVCAIAMGIVQHAKSTGAMWAILATVLIASLVVPVFAYCATFALASLFSLVGSAAVGNEKSQRIYTPTTRMDSAEIEES